MKKQLFILFLSLAATAGAVKMQPGIATLRQPDGTTLQVRAFGDEDYSYFLAADGALLYQEGNAFYVASVDAGGRLRPTRQLAHDPAARSTAETALTARQNRTFFYSRVGALQTAARLRREPVSTSSTLFPHTGSPRVPVLLVEFSDSTFKLNDTRKVFDKYLNGPDLFTTAADPEMGRNYGSVSRYFSDMSFGQFTPQFDVYGPYRLPEPLKRYGAGYAESEDMDALLKDACTAADGDVDFSQYDSNNDGNIDLVYIIYAGYSQSIAGNSTDCIHPKSGTLGIHPSFDGKKVVRYGVNNELNGTPANQTAGWLINGIGLFCHEFSHCLGLPDMYPSGGSVAERCINQNMDYWDLMDAGEYTYNGYRPTEYTAWEREALGWITIDTLAAPADVSLAPLSEGGKAWRIINDHDATKREYYLLENVQQKGWNGKLFGHGMLVSHVDYDPYLFSLGGTKVNQTPGHPRMTVVAADGMFVPEYFIGETISEGTTQQEKDINAMLIERYGGQQFTAAMYKAEAAGDPFPGTSSASELTDTSQPAAARVYTGATLGKPITGITEDPSTGVVSFRFMGGGTSVKTPVTDREEGPDVIYTLDGRRIHAAADRLPKGIYIVNGKKIIK